MKRLVGITKLIGAARQDRDILAVFLFGSAATGLSHQQSDIDICLVMKPAITSPIELSQKKLEYHKLTNDMDVQILQQLPLYIRIRVIKEGKVLFCVNEDELYEIAFRTISEFDDFKYIYDDYLNEVATVR